MSVRIGIGIIAWFCISCYWMWTEGHKVGRIYELEKMSDRIDTYDKYIADATGGLWSDWNYHLDNDSMSLSINVVTPDTMEYIWFTPDTLRLGHDDVEYLLGLGFSAHYRPEGE